MTEKKLYICDVCHTDYANKKDAIECENEHVSEIVEAIEKKIKSGESVICTDPMGKLWSEFYKIAKRHNYIVRELNLSDGCEEQEITKAATATTSSLNKVQIKDPNQKDRANRQK